MSFIRLPATQTAMARSSDSRVASSSLAFSSSTSPTATVIAASPKYPWYSMPKSMLTISPSFSRTRRLGIPCTTCSFSDTQMLAGNPR